MKSKHAWLMLVALLVTSLRPAYAQDKDAFLEIRLPQGHVHHAVFSADSKLLAGGVGANVFVWQVADGKQVAHAAPGKAELSSRVFRPGCQDARLVRTRGPDGAGLRRQERPPGPGVSAAGLGQETPGGRPGQGAEIRVLFLFPVLLPRRQAHGVFRAGQLHGRRRGRCGHRRGQLEDRGPAELARRRFAHDGKLLALHSWTDGIRVWDADSGKLVKEVLEHRKTARFGSRGFTTFSRDGKLLVICGQLTKELEIWDWQTGKIAHTLADRAYFRTAVLSSDHKHLLYIPAIGDIHLYDLAAKKSVHRFTPPERLAGYANFSPDGKKVVIIGPVSDETSSARPSIYLYDMPVLKVAAGN